MAQREKQHKRGPGITRALAFLVIVALLAAGVWFGVSWYGRSHVLPDFLSIKTGPTATVGVHGPAPKSLDIRVAGNTGDNADDNSLNNSMLRQVLVGNVYETLVGRDEHNRPAPGIAKSWKISKDGLKYTFTLNEKMRFSNGDTLESSDVINSLQIKTDGSDPAAETDGLVNMKSAENPTPSTVVIHLSKPNPRLLYALSTSSGIVYDSSANIDYAKQALGSGPFTVSSFHKGDSIVLERNPVYWGKKAACQQITVRYFNDTGALKTALHDDQIQLAALRPYDNPDAFRDDQSLTVSTGETTSKVVLALNSGPDSIFSDERARKAVRYVVDNAALAKSRPQAATVLAGPVSPLEPGYEDLTGRYPPNLATGRNNINYFSPSYIGTSKFICPQEYADLGQAVANQLNQTRLNVAIEILDDSAFYARLQSGNYTMALTTMNRTGDAGNFANSLFGYQNSEAQQLYSKAITANGDEAYQSDLRAYASVLCDDAASDWLFTEHSTIVSTRGTTGFPVDMTDQHLPLSGLKVS